MTTYHGHQIIGYEIQEQQGSFRREKIWIKGHHPVPGAVYGFGWLGKETTITRSVVSPICTFNVVEKKG